MARRDGLLDQPIEILPSQLDQRHAAADRTDVDQPSRDVAIVTLDERLALAARREGFPVLGV